MLFRSLSLLLLLVIVFVSADNQGSYTVPGLGKRKRQIMRAGGEVLDLAIAMMETDTMTTNYTYGDGKTGDSTNFGIFKQNWFMIRSSTTEFKGLGAKDVNRGVILNKKLAKDIKARQESQKYYGTDKWFGGHRNGETGLNQYDTQDIANYKNAVYWMRDQINSDKKYLTDDTRFYSYVVAI
ncbi:hypothetical protein G6F56_012977 [Rhizopus delemar]|nr:hypothetical protein G6F56_012977 [Rhizopus delemar]